ncbi:anthranilate phosphoribosyltransferase [Kribbella sp. CA-294648]|uniref:anthranilate phosphoribosyltransferase n=1 Tax=Kribbella sp. CA-294648 TaxID=3239948 RepID=UPI003D8DDEE2
MATTLRTTDYSWSALISDLLVGRELTPEELWWAMDSVVGGEATSAQLSGLLIALRAKGETPPEIAALASGVRRHAIAVDVPGLFVDIVGTGGDGTGAVNISTMAAIVAASTGVTVVKHGGRAASSQTDGSADLVEHLGIPLSLSPADVLRTVEAAGITYLFAPTFNPGLRQVAAVRRELGVPTAFNVLGPLINPADPQHQLVGVADPRMQPVIAAVLAQRGSTALVVRGNDGLDKLTTTAGSCVWVVRNGHAVRQQLDPRTLGIPLSSLADLRGSTAAANAAVLRSVLAGEPGPVRDVVLLNAAAAVAVSRLGPEPLEPQLANALQLCAEAIDSGGAATTLARWVAA